MCYSNRYVIVCVHAAQLYVLTNCCTATTSWWEEIEHAPLANVAAERMKDPFLV